MTLDYFAGISHYVVSLRLLEIGPLLGRTTSRLLLFAEVRQSLMKNSSVLFNQTGIPNFYEMGAINTNQKYVFLTEHRET